MACLGVEPGTPVVFRLQERQVSRYINRRHVWAASSAMFVREKKKRKLFMWTEACPRIERGTPHVIQSNTYITTMGVFSGTPTGRAK